MRVPLLIALALAAPPASAAETPADLAAAIQKATAAYNAQDVKYYEANLTADAVYIADDGATFAGKQRIVGLFTKLFARTPPPQLAVTDVVTVAKGDVAWARFKWALSGGAKARSGVGTTLFAREGGEWRIVQIQNTLDGHAAPHGH